MAPDRDEDDAALLERLAMAKKLIQRALAPGANIGHGRGASRANKAEH